MSHSRDKDSDENPKLRRSHVDLSRMILQGRSFSGLERHCSFLNTGVTAEGGGRFATISSSSGLDFPDDGRALALVDWDHDGDLDVWLSARNAPRIRLMQNTSQTQNRSIIVGLKGNGVTTSRDAIGARAEVVFKDRKQDRSIQTLRAGEGFFSQDSKWLHFGLGERDDIDHILVKWPGGSKELFTGFSAGNRYLLTQDSGSAVAIDKRIGEKSVFQVSEPIIPEPASQARIPLMTRMPLLSLPIRDFKGKPQLLEPGVGGPVLITLWASWCPACKAELTEFTEKAEELKAAGLGVLALSVDGLGDERADLVAGKKLLDDLDFPFPMGFATQELVQKFQEIHDELIPLKLPLPIPTSLLIDARGQVSVIYKGQAKVEDVINDITKLTDNTNFGLVEASPLSGRSIGNEQLQRVAKQNKVRTLFKRGVSLADRNQFEEAILFYLKALELQPQSYKINYNLGVANLSLQKLDVAYFYLDQAIKLRPDFLLSHKALGQLQLQKNNYTEARSHFRRYLTSDSGNVDVINSLGVIALKKGELASAEQLFNQAAKFDPMYVETRYNLGILLLRQDKLKEAENAFLQILAIQPHYPEVLYNLGYVAELSGENQRAANLYLGELRTSPSSVAALTGLARIMEKSGDHDRAKKYYGQAVDIDPGYKPAIEGMQRLN